MINVGDVVYYISHFSHKKIYGVVQRIHRENSLNRLRVYACWFSNRSRAIETHHNSESLHYGGKDFGKVWPERINNWREVIQNAI